MKAFLAVVRSEIYLSGHRFSGDTSLRLSRRIFMSMPKGIRKQAHYQEHR